MFLRSVLAILILLSASARCAEHRLYVGTYTRGDSASDGIYTCTFDDQSGRLSKPTLAIEADNPSFLAVHPSGRFLFACIETNDFGEEATGAVASYAIDSSGKLKLLSEQPSGGGAPCHCNVDASGRFLLVANYLGGNVAVFPIDNDGKLGAATSTIQHIGSGPNKQRQEAPHAHSINLSADNKYAYAADLGVDKVMIYRFDSQDGLLVPSAADAAAIPAGGGPRHFSIHPSGRFAYSNNELTCEVTTFVRNTHTGSLKGIQQSSTLPGGYDGRKSTAECLVHPNGKFLYVSNRGHDSIASFAIDQDTGKLTRFAITKTGGMEPRNFFIIDGGKWLIAANQNSDTLVVFVIQEDGTIRKTGSTVDVGKPVCVRAFPAK